MKIEKVQKFLQQNGLDGWLLYDFRRSNSIAIDFLSIGSEVHLTRRLFYWIPQKGIPVAIVHQVEAHVAAHLPGEKKAYSSIAQLEAVLRSVLKGSKKVAMEYSKECNIPTLSKVDAGMVEKIRSIGLEVVSSGNFLQYLLCEWSDEQLDLHRQAGKVLDQVAAKSWDWVRAKLKSGQLISEYDVQQFILKEIHSAGCVMEGEPICGVNKHSALPHYAPSQQGSAPIRKGDWILIDLWCKKNVSNSVYADISRVAVADTGPTPQQEKVFDVVLKAQKQATTFVQKRVEEGKEVRGFEVDLAARQVIEEAGYGEYFTHRTGHNIHEEDHGPGANIDGFETYDDRLLIPRTCFSIEPGIYLPEEFGVRLEYDVYLHPGKIEINGGVQNSIVRLL
jgi:Xaa-Pro dipeptidase